MTRGLADDSDAPAPRLSCQLFITARGDLLMSSRRQQIRNRFQLESLEGRMAPSSVHGMDDHGRHGGAEINMHRHGQDDPAGHDANDNRGGVRGRNGQDDPAGHDANDNRGSHR